MKRLGLSDPKDIGRESKSRVTGSAFLHPDQGGQWPAINGRPALKSGSVRHDDVRCGSAAVVAAFATPCRTASPRALSSRQPQLTRAARGAGAVVTGKRVASICNPVATRPRHRAPVKESAAAHPPEMRPAQTRFSSDPKPHRAFSVRSARVAVKTNSRGEATSPEGDSSKYKNLSYSSVATEVSRRYPPDREAACPCTHIEVLFY